MATVGGVGPFAALVAATRDRVLPRQTVEMSKLHGVAAAGFKPDLLKGYYSSPVQRCAMMNQNR